MELCYPPRALTRTLMVAPYLFGANGWGWIMQPTAVERHFITAGSAGVGARIGLDIIPWLERGSASVTVEMGHQFSDVAGRANGERASLAVGLRF